MFSDAKILNIFSGGLLLPGHTVYVFVREKFVSHTVNNVDAADSIFIRYKEGVLYIRKTLFLRGHFHPKDNILWFIPIFLNTGWKAIFAWTKVSCRPKDMILT